MRRRLKSWFGSALLGARLHRRFFRDRALVVTFHRVRDDMPGNPITCTTAAFGEYCDLFARYFEVIPLSELLDRLQAKRSISGCLSITFDDGYRDNATIAAPELRRRGLPACFFVATEFIGSNATPWWDTDWNVPSEWMSWDDVRGLHADGFEVGGHTLNHVDLGLVAGEEARREIFGCRERLAQELGEAPRHFSYPYGRRHQINPEARALVREAGFECCLSSYGGSVRPTDDRFHLLRSPISPWHESASQLAFELALDG